MSLTDAERLTHGSVSSRVDYWYVLFSGLPHVSAEYLQRALNIAARIIPKSRKSDRITPISASNPINSPSSFFPAKPN